MENWYCEYCEYCENLECKNESEFKSESCEKVREQGVCDINDPDRAENYSNYSSAF